MLMLEDFEWAIFKQKSGCSLNSSGAVAPLSYCTHQQSCHKHLQPFPETLHQRTGAGPSLFPETLWESSESLAKDRAQRDCGAGMRWGD